jgi:hypothetical protein
MKALIEFLEYELPTVHNYIGGVVCIMIAILCLLIIRELHLTGKCLCPKCDDEGLSLGGFFALNASLFLLAAVVLFKAYERIFLLRLVNMADLIRETLALILWIYWLVSAKKRRGKSCDNPRKP